jgi:hypothetical protein
LAHESTRIGPNHTKSACSPPATTPEGTRLGSGLRIPIPRLDAAQEEEIHMKKTSLMKNPNGLATTLALSTVAKALHDGAGPSQIPAAIAAMDMSTAVARELMVALVDVQLAAHLAGNRLPDDVHTMAMQFYKDAACLTNEEFWTRVDALASRIQAMPVDEKDSR